MRSKLKNFMAQTLLLQLFLLAGLTATGIHFTGPVKGLHCGASCHEICDSETPADLVLELLADAAFGRKADGPQVQIELSSDLLDIPGTYPGDASPAAAFARSTGYRYEILRSLSVTVRFSNPAFAAPARAPPLQAS
jgi:hypothetical protein